MFLKQKMSVEWSRFKVKLNIALSRVANVLKLQKDMNYYHLLVDKVNDQAQADYKPRVYAGTVILFKPRRDYAGLNDPFFGWGDKALKGVDIVNIPFSPKAILTEPFVETFAQKLGEEIDKACSNREEIIQK